MQAIYIPRRSSYRGTTQNCKLMMTLSESPSNPHLCISGPSAVGRHREIRFAVMASLELDGFIYAIISSTSACAIVVVIAE
jgi:hypothetical protein